MKVVVEDGREEREWQCRGNGVARREVEMGGGWIEV